MEGDTFAITGSVDFGSTTHEEESASPYVSGWLVEPGGKTLQVGSVIDEATQRFETEAFTAWAGTYRTELTFFDGYDVVNAELTFVAAANQSTIVVNYVNAEGEVVASETDTGTPGESFSRGLGHGIGNGEWRVVEPVSAEFPPRDQSTVVEVRVEPFVAPTAGLEVTGELLAGREVTLSGSVDLGSHATLESAELVVRDPDRNTVLNLDGLTAGEWSVPLTVDAPGEYTATLVAHTSEGTATAETTFAPVAEPPITGDLETPLPPSSTDDLDREPVPSAQIEDRSDGSAQATKNGSANDGQESGATTARTLERRTVTAADSESDEAAPSEPLEATNEMANGTGSATGSEVMAPTGANSGVLALAAVALIGGGLLLIAALRRRRRSDD